MSQPLRVLHIVGSMTPGGMENFIMNIYEQIDKSKIQFDIILHLRKEKDYVSRIEEMGGTVYQLPRLSRKPFSNLKKLYRIVRDNQYKIVIRHTANALITPQLLAARLAGAYTICHSHNETDPQKFLHRLGRLLMRIAANERFSCSPRAGAWMFGRKKYTVVHNAINIKKFQYNSDAEQKIRKEFGLKTQHVYGYVANFLESKNHVYLLSIFRELLKLDADAKLFCVGDGTLRETIELQVKRLGLEGNVVLTGMRNDVEDFMSCFDMMIFPSKFEGLPLTIIESQAAGLPCLMSDAVTSDVIVTEGLVETESLDAVPQIWAERAFKTAGKIPADSKGANRVCQYESIAKAGYDIKCLAKWYEDYFMGLVSVR